MRSPAKKKPPHLAVGTQPPHAPALAGCPQCIGEHAGMAWVGPVPGIVPDGGEPHVFLLPTDKIKSPGMFPAMPLLKVDPRAIPGREHLAALGRTLPEFLQRPSLERVPVVLLRAFDLIGRRQMSQRMGPQMEGKEVARGIPDAIVRGRRVMGGSSVKGRVARSAVDEAARKATPDVGYGDFVPARFHPLAHAGERARAGLSCAPSFPDAGGQSRGRSRNFSASLDDAGTFRKPRSSRRCDLRTQAFQLPENTLPFGNYVALS